MLQISYINLFSTLSKINSPLINNDIIINKLIDYLINENSGKDILLSFLVQMLSLIYTSLQSQNLLTNKRLKYIYECLVKTVMNIFDSKLLFNQKYGMDNLKNDFNKINADEIENADLNKKEQSITDNKNNNTENNNINTNTNDSNTKNDNKNSENNNNYNFKDIVNKGIIDYITIIRFCSSSKNLNSADNISEEIDLDDFNEDDAEDNDNIGNNKNFTLTSFDEIDDDEENKSDNDTIAYIFKKTAETIKSIKLRNKNNSKDIDNKEKEENIKDKENKNIIKEEKNEITKEEICNNNDNDDINKDKKCVQKENVGLKSEEKKINKEMKENIMKIEDKKINDILNKSHDKIKHNLFLESDITNEKDDTNRKKINNISHLNDNPETSNKVNTRSIFNYNDKNNINALPKIKKKSEDQEHGRYFYREGNSLSRINLNEKINNFRSNNIIKTKENKEYSLFQSLRKSSENGANYKYCLTLFNKHNDHNGNKCDEHK